MNKTDLSKPSEVLQYIIDKGVYHAYLRPDPDGSPRRRGRRMCFCVEDLRLHCFLEGDTRRAIMLSLDGHTFLSNILSDRFGYASPYDANPAMRRHALAHWRRLIAKLQEQGQ